MKRKRILGIVAILTIGSLMCGCGEANATEAEPVNETAEVEETVEEESEPEEPELSEEEIKAQEEAEKAQTEKEEIEEAAIDLLRDVYKELSALNNEAMKELDGSEAAEKISTYMVKENISEIVYSPMDDKLVEDFTGNGAAIYQLYRGDDIWYYFYAGEIENNLKSGTGIAGVEIAGGYIYDVCYGQWENDKPNGRITECVESDTGAEYMVYTEYTGDCVDGAFNGEVGVRFVEYKPGESIEQGTEYAGRCTFVDGIIQHDSKSDKSFESEEGSEVVVLYDSEGNVAKGVSINSDSPYHVYIYRYTE